MRLAVQRWVARVSSRAPQGARGRELSGRARPRAGQQPPSGVRLLESGKHIRAQLARAVGSPCPGLSRAGPGPAEPAAAARRAGRPEPECTPGTAPGACRTGPWSLAVAVPRGGCRSQALCLVGPGSQHPHSCSLLASTAGRAPTWRTAAVWTFKRKRVFQKQEFENG